MGFLDRQRGSVAEEFNPTVLSQFYSESFQMIMKFREMNKTPSIPTQPTQILTVGLQQPVQPVVPPVVPVSRGKVLSVGLPLDLVVSRPAAIAAAVKHPHQITAVLPPDPVNLQAPQGSVGKFIVTQGFPGEGQATATTQYLPIPATPQTYITKGPSTSTGNQQDWDPSNQAMSTPIHPNIDDMDISFPSKLSISNSLLRNTPTRVVDPDSVEPPTKDDQTK